MTRQLMMLAILVASSFGFSSCDQEEKRQKKECEALSADIEAELSRVNHCETDYDCRVQSVHPHYGCYIQYNKFEDTRPAADLINEYSNGSCWDGRTTLRLLDCPLAAAGNLSCVAGTCKSGFGWSARRSQTFQAFTDSKKKWDAAGIDFPGMDAAYKECEELFAESSVAGHEAEPEYAYIMTFVARDLGLETCSRQTRGCIDGIMPCENPVAVD